MLTSQTLSWENGESMMMKAFLYSRLGQMTNAKREPLTKLRPSAKTRVRNYFTQTPMPFATI